MTSTNVTSTTLEIELKLAIAKSALTRLERWSPPPDWRATALERRLYAAHYFDTPDQRLRRAGIALRVRAHRKKLKRTVKFGRVLENGLSQPNEYEDQIHAPRPDIETIADRKLRARMLKAIGDATVGTSFEASIRRASRVFEVPGEGAVEIAMDTGEIFTRDNRAAVSELEIELLSGAPFVILTVAETLLAGVRFKPSSNSKAGIGYALLDAAQGPLEPASKADAGSTQAERRKPRLSVHHSSAEGLAEIGRTSTRQILASMRGCLETDELEMPHRLRVGLRRLRTAIRLFRPLTGTPAMRALATDARDLGRIVGLLRDADVLMTDVIAPAADAGAVPSAAMPGLLEIVRTHRERQRAAVRASLASTKWNRLQLNVMLFDYAIARATHSSAQDEAEPDLGRLAPVKLTKSWRRVRKWGNRIDDLDIAERHEMRKALKELRYATEFFAPLLPGSGAFLKRLKKLQEIFGYLNDVTLTDHLTEIVRSANRQRSGRPSGTERQSQRRAMTDASKAIRAWHFDRAEVAWKDAKTIWNELRQNTPEWV